MTLHVRSRPGGSRAARPVLAALTVAGTLAVAATLAGAACAPAGVTESPSSAYSASSEPAAPARPDTGARQPLAAASADPTIPVVTATLGPSLPRTESPEPVRLEYAAIGARLPVVPTGVADDGQMEVPEDAATAGWYRFGPAPADGVGNTVIAAHAGSEQTPEGPLYGLRNARPGDLARVEDASGRHHAYRVTTVDRLGKAGLDFTPYFTRSGPGRLVLVTCSGQWLPERESYADNIIVVAESLD